MLQTLLDSKFPDVKFGILAHLGPDSLLKCRLVSRKVKEIVDSDCTFVAKLNDKKIRKRKLVLFSLPAHVKKYSPLQNLRITRLEIGKLTSPLDTLFLGPTWEHIEEIDFTRAVTTANYRTVLKACPHVRTIRLNYLALGGKRPENRWFREKLKIFKPYPNQIREADYYLPFLESIHVDRNLDTKDYICSRGKHQFKHFDADLYFKTMSRLIEALEKEVQQSIMKLLKTQILNNVKDNGYTGIFFTKLDLVNRFPMDTETLNAYCQKLRI